MNTDDWADRIRNSTAGSREWYQAYRDREYEQSSARAKSVQREELQQQDILPERDGDSKPPRSQSGCNNVVLPPGSHSTYRKDTDSR